MTTPGQDHQHEDDQSGGHGHDHSHDHSHSHDHGHGHGHENDQGVKALLRYLRFAPEMLFSELNRTVVDMIAAGPGERLVDIGSGMGPGVVHAAKRGAEVVAVEPTGFMRKILTVRRLLQRSRGNIQIVDGAAEKIPVESETVDAVMAVNTMHHWIDLEQGVKEIARVLKPGGRILLLDEDFQNPDHPDFERFGGHDEADGHEHHGFTLVDAANIGGLLTDAGLVDVDAGDKIVAGVPVISVAGRKAG